MSDELAPLALRFSVAALSRSALRRMGSPAVARGALGSADATLLLSGSREWASAEVAAAAGGSGSLTTGSAGGAAEVALLLAAASDTALPALQVVPSEPIALVAELWAANASALARSAAAGAGSGELPIARALPGATIDTTIARSWLFARSGVTGMADAVAAAGVAAMAEGSLSPPAVMELSLRSGAAALGGGLTWRLSGAPTLPARALGGMGAMDATSAAHSVTLSSEGIALVIPPGTLRPGYV
jgi:hypothetical protein